MSKWHGGKGSSLRKTDQEKYSENWEKIFNVKKDSRTSNQTTENMVKVAQGGVKKKNG